MQGNREDLIAYFTHKEAPDPEKLADLSLFMMNYMSSRFQHERWDLNALWFDGFLEITAHLKKQPYDNDVYWVRFLNIDDNTPTFTITESYSFTKEITSPVYSFDLIDDKTFSQVLTIFTNDTKHLRPTLRLP